MKLYLINAENIYFPQIKEYFREIISSYDNGNYRSAIVMLYSTIICDLLLKLKELIEVYNDTAAEKLLEEINSERKQTGNSSWEKKLIELIRQRTELLTDESFSMICHIRDLRNLSAHPAMNEDYELISPSPEMTVAYIKKALEDILVKPSVFAQNIVDTMSNDISERQERFRDDFEAFEMYLNKVYFQRMSTKMLIQVFRAFWKFTFKKVDDENDIFEKNRHINRKTLESMLNKHGYELCDYVGQNTTFFTIAENSDCMAQACTLMAYFPQLYNKLDENVRNQIKAFNKKNITVIKWFESDSLEKHIEDLNIRGDSIHANILSVLKKVCNRQGQPRLFYTFLLNHYSKTNSFTSARDRFDKIIEPYLEEFDMDCFVRLIDIINENDQIYQYSGQRSRNNRIIDVAKLVLPEDFNYDAYENFRYSKTENTKEPVAEETETDLLPIPDDDTDLPF